MGEFSIDLLYAYAQLGLNPGASLADIQAVGANAVAYPFSTKQRIKHVERFVDFFVARQKFGAFGIAFEDIKKAYHRQAMDLHPDRNKTDPAAENRLKEINIAYALVEDTHRQARIYYKKSQDIRHEIERLARASTEAEKQTSQPPPTDAPQTPPPRARSRHAKPVPGHKSGIRKYQAAPVPRTIRTARLSYLPVHTIIGSLTVRQANDINLIYDIIMLPEKQFLRARSYLAAPDTALPALQYGKFAPAYTLRDIKEVRVPDDETNPENFARDYFRKEFGVQN